MKLKYDLLKLVLGIGFMSHLMNCLIESAGQRIWKNLAAIFLLFFLVLKRVSFVKGEESAWTFFIVLIATVPANLRMACWAAACVFSHLNPVSRLMYDCILYLCLLAAEEVLMGIAARVICYPSTS